MAAMTTHQRLPMVAMPCARCRTYADGVCCLTSPSGEGIAAEYVGECCCPVCKPAPPLEPGEVRAVVDPKQEELF